MTHANLPTAIAARHRPVFAAFLAMLVLAALDQTILSTALPAIGRELHGEDRLSWVFSAYLMASTVAIPLYGRLADAFGSRRLLLAAIALFLAGSLACGTADTMTQLVVARAVQGLGGGGLLTLTLLGVADLVAPEGRSAYQGLLGGTYGLATLFGPLVGGYLVENVSWHWAFFINLPPALVALGVVAWRMPQAVRAAGQRIDYAGAALLGASLVCVLLGTRREATQPGLLFAAGAVLAAVFLVVQRRAEHPILPLALFGRAAFTTGVAISAATGVALFSAVVFLPTYLQSALLKTPTGSAWHLLPLMGGLTAAAVSTGRLLRRGVPLRRMAIRGALLMTAGLLGLALAFRVAPGAAPLLSLCLVPLGLGIGMLFPVVTVLAQRSAPPRHLGVATSTPVMLRSLGGALGVSALGSMLSEGIARQLAAVTGRVTHEAFAAAFAQAVQPLYLWAAAVALAVVVLAWWHVPQRMPMPAAAAA